MLYTCHGNKTIHHPQVGDIELAYEPAAMSTDPDLRLVLYAAEPGSPSADALRLLASWAATETTPELTSAQEGTNAQLSFEMPARRPSAHQ